MKVFVAVEFEINIPDDAKECPTGDEASIDSYIEERLLRSLPEHIKQLDYMWDRKQGVLEL